VAIFTTIHYLRRRVELDDKRFHLEMFVSEVYNEAQTSLKTSSNQN